MNKEFLETLYQTSPAFKLFVDRNCQSYGFTKEQAFKDRIIQSYAEYVVKDQQEEKDKKEIRYETTRTCDGC